MSKFSSDSNSGGSADGGGDGKGAWHEVWLVWCRWGEDGVR